MTGSTGSGPLPRAGATPSVPRASVGSVQTDVPADQAPPARPRAGRARLVGALVGQGTLAVSGLVLQVAAARELGAAGLAGFSLVYGAIVLATAVSSGLVGDSLVVLDRHAAGVRAALHVLGVAVAIGTGAVGLLLVLGTGWGTAATGVWVGLATVAFVLEDLLRRLLMATGRYWRLPAVDLSGAVVSLGVLVLLAAGRPLVVADVFLALAVGQAVSCAVALVLLPRGERPGGPWRGPQVREVLGFGVWRAAGQTVRPATLTLLRLAVIGAAGAAAYGPVEAARVVTAPTLVLVAGVGSFLLPWFAGARHRPAAELLRRADLAAGAAAVGIALAVLVTVALLPWLGPLLSGGDYQVPVEAVAGWGAYAVTGALLLPYAGLASVHGAQRAVLGWRVVEMAALVGVLVLVLARPSAAGWAPAVLAAGPVAAAAAVRWRVLVPRARVAAAA